jgi:hypothetical protein
VQTSIYLAKLMGPVFCLAGLGFLLNRQAFLAIAEDFVENTGMIMMSGFFALVMGLAIVNAHNVWVADWPVIITIFGWASLIVGFIRITMPDIVSLIAKSILGMRSFLTIHAIILIIFGSWMSYVGYMS